MTAGLAPVYLDDTRVTLQGDPRPKVAKILQAGGHPTDALVVRVEGGQALGPDEVIDRTTALGPVHLRTSKPGNVQVPGDILRGTEGRAGSAAPTPSAPVPSAPGVSSEQEARAGRVRPQRPAPKSQRFAESQSFADPVHKGGSPRVAPGAEPSPPGLRTQGSGSQEGGRPPRRPSTVTPSRESLARTTEEE